MTDCQQENLHKSIIFHNQEENIFLVDIPRSIAEAQQLSWSTNAEPQTQSDAEGLAFKAETQRSIISAPPLEKPYDSSTEPKTEAARAKVLSRIPLSEQRFHGQFIQPLVATALDEITAEYQSDDKRWCLPRASHDEKPEHQGHQGELKLDDHDSSTTKKRKKNQSTNEYYAADFSLMNEHTNDMAFSSNEPPTILSSTSPNIFSSLTELTRSVVRSPYSKDSTLLIGKPSRVNENSHSGHSEEYTVPPLSNFILCTLPLSQPEPLETPIPGLSSEQLFNLILFDPPWPNRSVKRSREYQTHSYSDMDLLSKWIQDVLRVHAYRPPCDTEENSLVAQQSLTSSHGKHNSSQENFAAIWITNSEKTRKVAYEALLSSGFIIYEEWIWVKTTASGEAVCPVDGIWRKPYEILVIGRKYGRKYQPSMVPGLDISLESTAQSAEDDLLGVDPGTIPRRVIAAVPDLHSRKPNLKLLFERLLFKSDTKDVGMGALLQYSALEVFARNLTAEWWACGNEVLKFNARDHWLKQGDLI